jgi:hypothetical protein
MGMKDYFIYHDIKFCTGDKVTCEIYGAKINDAKIYVTNAIEREEDRHYIIGYICQNLRSGWRPQNLLGYKYGWAFSYYNKIPLINPVIMPIAYDMDCDISNLQKINIDNLANIVNLSFPKR